MRFDNTRDGDIWGPKVKKRLSGGLAQFWTSARRAQKKEKRGGGGIDAARGTGARLVAKGLKERERQKKGFTRDAREGQSRPVFQIDRKKKRKRGGRRRRSRTARLHTYAQRESGGHKLARRRHKEKWKTG